MRDKNNVSENSPLFLQGPWFQFLVREPRSNKLESRGNQETIKITVKILFV